MPQDLPALLVRAIVQSLAEISGSQYESLLRQIGWERFREALPAPDPRLPTAPGADFSQLVALIYAMLGENGTRLFLRNLGTRFAGYWAASPPYIALQEVAVTVPAAQKLPMFMRSLMEMIRLVWAPCDLEEDATAWYLLTHQCWTCQNLPAVQAPICLAPAANFALAAQGIVGHRVRVEEITCRAMGAPDCKFAFYK